MNWEADLTGERAEFLELSALTMPRPRPPFVHQHAVDAFSAQHLHEGMSKIQRLFGLMGLCLLCEHGADGLEVQREHVRRAKESKEAWPLVPVRALSFEVRVGDVLRAGATDEAVIAWARSTWSAHAPNHEIVRRFVRG